MSLRLGAGLASDQLKIVFDEVADRWLQFPCDLPYDDGLSAVGSALL